MIRFVHEKNNGGRTTRSMRDFGEFVHSWGLKDSPLSNAEFAWTNGQENPTLCHLDRFWVSMDWEDIYPQPSQR